MSDTKTKSAEPGRQSLGVYDTKTMSPKEIAKAMRIILEARLRERNERQKGH